MLYYSLYERRDKMELERLLTSILNLGEQMLLCGAEISRVEDTIKRLCYKYGCKKVDIFAITSVIFLTLTDEDDNFRSASRRVQKYNTNLDKLHKYNALSRKICSEEEPKIETLEQGITEISSEKHYPLYVQCLACALIASAFTVFFGGSFFDAAASAVIGIILKLIIQFTNKTKVNMVFANVVCSAIACFLAFSLVKLGFGEDVSMIIIGNIMILIPGVALTNSIRDMISGDIMSGLLRACEAIVIALAIAAGYILVALVFGGAV